MIQRYGSIGDMYMADMEPRGAQALREQRHARPAAGLGCRWMPGLGCTVDTYNPKNTSKRRVRAKAKKKGWRSNNTASYHRIIRTKFTHACVVLADYDVAISAWRGCEKPSSLLCDDSGGDGIGPCLKICLLHARPPACTSSPSPLWPLVSAPRLLEP